VSEEGSLPVVLQAPTTETSGFSKLISPAGFHEAAVASSATAMNADCPNALAPEPTGSGATGILVYTTPETPRVRLAPMMSTSVRVLRSDILLRRVTYRFVRMVSPHPIGFDRLCSLLKLRVLKTLGVAPDPADGAGATTVDQQTQQSRKYDRARTI
jgi:hypothetical protein